MIVNFFHFKNEWKQLKFRIFEMREWSRHAAKYHWKNGSYFVSFAVRQAYLYGVRRGRTPDSLPKANCNLIWYSFSFSSTFDQPNKNVFTFHSQFENEKSKQNECLHIFLHMLCCCLVFLLLDVIFSGWVTHYWLLWSMAIVERLVNWNFMSCWVVQNYMI